MPGPGPAAGAGRPGRPLASYADVVRGQWGSHFTLGRIFAR